MWIHRRTEEPACTEVACYWKKSVLSGVGTKQKFIMVSELTKSCDKLCMLDTSSFLNDVTVKLSESNLEVQLSKYTIKLDSKKIYALSLHQIFIAFNEENQKNADNFILFA